MKYLKNFRIFEGNSFKGAAYSFVNAANNKLSKLWELKRLYPTFNKEITDEERFICQFSEFVIEYNGNTFRDFGGKKIPTSTLKIWCYGSPYDEYYKTMKSKLFNGAFPKKPEDITIEPDSILERLPGFFGPESYQRTHHAKLLQSAFGHMTDGNFEEEALKNYRWLQVLPNDEFLQMDDAGATSTIDRLIYQFKKERKM